MNLDYAFILRIFKNFVNICIELFFMNYCVLLAAGSGTRIEQIGIPKQFYEINNVPIVIHTLRKFTSLNCFDYIYLAVNEEYSNFMCNLLKKFFEKSILDKISIVLGGTERIDSIHNVIQEINLNEIHDDDIIVIHDAVRPFVSKKIILENIENANKYGAVVTAVPVNDTILKSENGDYVDSIPVRKMLFNGQSPDSFKLKTFIDLENNLTDNQKKIITGTSQICTLNNYPIKMVEGDNVNFKITTDADLEMAKLILSKEDVL